MTSQTPTLSDLRNEIDRIDEALHDLLMRRAEVIDRVRALKSHGAGGVFRPAREAAVLRRLVGRHRGSVPRSLIVRLWREIMAASASSQGPFTIAVSTGGGAGYWDLARDHFGAVAPMSRHETVRGAIHAVATGEATLGVLPLPEDGECNPWWPTLAGGVSAPLRICARLPFMPDGNGQGHGLSALVIGEVAFEPSGDDHSYLLVESPAGVSRTKILAALSEAGLQAGFLAAWQDGGADAPTLFLVEVPDYIGEGDARLARLAEAGGAVTNVRAAGGYATPLSQADLGLRASRGGARR